MPDQTNQTDANNTQNQQTQTQQQNNTQTQQPANQQTQQVQTVDVDQKIQSGVESAQRKAERESLHNKLGHLKRTDPDGYKELMNKFGGSSGEDTNEQLREALNRVNKLELERARERALRKYSLEDEDERFLFGKTAEEIEEQAKSLSDRYNKFRPKDADGKPIVQIKEPETQKANLPKYDKSSGKTEVQFFESQLDEIARAHS